MFGKLESWFSGLTKAGKIGVVIASLIGLSVAAAPFSSSKPSAPAQVEPSSQPQTKAAVIEKKTVTETQPIPFEKTSVDDSTLAKGATKIQTVGVNGVKTLTYEVTLTNGTQTAKKLMKEEVTTPPITEVTVIGTYVYVAPQPTTQAAPSTQSTGARTGAVCKDGSSSTATGSGACSHHGGVAYWTY